MVSWFDHVYDDKIVHGGDQNGWILASWPFNCVQCHRPTYYIEINFEAYLHPRCEYNFLLPLLKEELDGL